MKTRFYLFKTTFLFSLFLFSSFVFLSGCHSWRVVQKSRLQNDNFPTKKMRVTIDGKMYVAYPVSSRTSKTKVSSTSGFLPWRFYSMNGKKRKLFFHKVERVEIPVYDSSKTTGLVIGLVLPIVGGLTIAIVAAGKMGSASGWAIR